MSARKSGGGATRRRNKDVAQAAYMKEKGITRHVCRCPMCHGLIRLAGLYRHLGQCGHRTE